MNNDIQAIPVNLDDYILSGGGANGESYDHRSDPSVMLKLYFPGKTAQALDELQRARKVFDIGVPTPEPGEFVVSGDGRYGIRFRRIHGKKSYSRATADEPGRVVEFASEFALMCKELHGIHVDTAAFECVKDCYYRLLESNPFFNVQEKDKIGRFISDVPDADTALHGDLQYSNAIFSPEGRYFIDLGDFCYGHPLFDLGQVYLCCCLSDEDFIREVFHMPKTLAEKFWECFAAGYFGTSRPLSDIEEEVLPFAGLKTLIIERETRREMPEFRAALKSIL